MNYRFIATTFMALAAMITGVGAADPTGSSPAGDGIRRARMLSAGSTLEKMQGIMVLYSVQHGEKPPPLKELATWNALLKKTDNRGDYGGRAFLGPYIEAAPINPFTGRSGVVAAGSGSTSDGWTWEEGQGKLRIIVPESEVELFAGKFGKDGVEVVKGSALPLAAGGNSGRRLDTLLPVLTTIRSQLKLYELQHADKAPTWTEMADWKILLSRSDAGGHIGANMPLGPYLDRKSLPLNALTGKSTIVQSGSASTEAGWTYDEKTGTIRAIVSATNVSEAEMLLGKDGFELAK